MWRPFFSASRPWLYTLPEKSWPNSSDYHQMKSDMKPDCVVGAQFLCWINPNTPAYIEHMASEGPAPKPVVTVEGYENIVL